MSVINICIQCFLKKIILLSFLFCSISWDIHAQFNIGLDIGGNISNAGFKVNNDNSKKFTLLHQEWFSIGIFMQNNASEKFLFSIGINQVYKGFKVFYSNGTEYGSYAQRYSSFEFPFILSMYLPVIKKNKNCFKGIAGASLQYFNSNNKVGVIGSAGFAYEFKLKKIGIFNLDLIYNHSFNIMDEPIIKQSISGINYETVLIYRGSYLSLGLRYYFFRNRIKSTD